MNERHVISSMAKQIAQQAQKNPVPIVPGESTSIHKGVEAVQAMYSAIRRARVIDTHMASARVTV